MFSIISKTLKYINENTKNIHLLEILIRCKFYAEKILFDLIEVDLDKMCHV